MLYFKTAVAGRGVGAGGTHEQREREEQTVDHSRRDSKDPAMTPKAP